VPHDCTRTLAAAVYIVDCLKDVIINGGENLYSTEFENALAAGPRLRGAPSPTSPSRTEAGAFTRSSSCGQVPA
jgi:acyl-CoA synthetase (AMP-forming)/AMP-acid ligase II